MIIDINKNGARGDLFLAFLNHESHGIDNTNSNLKKSSKIIYSTQFTNSNTSTLLVI